jgi:hypothetical protein
MGSDLPPLISSGDQTTEHIRVHGWMRVPEAFDSAGAAAMRDVVWHGLADVGVQRDAPATWTIEWPVKLQKLKDHPAFNAVGSARHPPPAGARSADMRKSLQRHPYVRDLHIEGDRESRIDRFMNRVEEVDGIPLQVVENTGAAGDVILLHPLTLHVAAPNNGIAPRFLLSGAITTDMHGWAPR